MTSTDTAATAALAAGPDVAAAALRWMHEGELLIAYGFADSPSINHVATAKGEADAYTKAADAFRQWPAAEIVRIWFIDHTGQIRHQAAGSVADVRAAIARWPYEAHRFPRLRRTAATLGARTRTAMRRHREPLTRSVLPLLLLALVGLAGAAAVALAPHSVSLSLGQPPATTAAAPLPDHTEHADRAPAPASPDCMMLCDHTATPDQASPAQPAPDHSCIMLCSAADAADHPRPTAAMIGAALHRLA